MMFNPFGSYSGFCRYLEYRKNYSLQYRHYLISTNTASHSLANSLYKIFLILIRKMFHVKHNFVNLLKDEYCACFSVHELIFIDKRGYIYPILNLWDSVPFVCILLWTVVAFQEIFCHFSIFNCKQLSINNCIIISCKQKLIIFSKL